MNEIIDCGNDAYNYRVARALEYVPLDVMERHGKRIRIFSVTKSDAIRLTRSFCKGHDIIVLSEHAFPTSGIPTVHQDYRYFIYVILHEVAHAVKNHRSPKLDHLSPDEASAQEDEAKNLAIAWFNEHAKTLPDEQPPLAHEEIARTERDREQTRFNLPCR